jgi:hypothetical protein
MKAGTDAEFSMGRSQEPINCVAKGRYAKNKNLPYKLLFLPLFFFL